MIRPVDRASPTHLILAIVQIDDVHDLVRRLVERGFGATRIDTAGGFLRRDNSLVLIATTDERRSLAMAILRETCRTRMATWLPTVDDGTVGLYSEPIEVEVGGAVVFEFPIEHVEFLSAVVDPVHRAATANRGGER